MVLAVSSHFDVSGMPFILISLKHASNEVAVCVEVGLTSEEFFQNTAGQTPLNSYLLPYWYITCASLFIMF
jgi:hypothetical protein